MTIVTGQNNLLPRLCTMLLLLFSITTTQALNQPKSIDLTSAAWVNGARSDGTGLYWDIMRLVYEPLGIKVKYNITDYAHSVSLVKEGLKDAWIGSYLNEEAGIIYPKWHFDADYVNALVKKSTDLDWQGINSLVGKNVGWIEGYNYQKYIDVDFNIKEYATRARAIAALADGKLDFFLEARNELNNEFIKHPEKMDKFTQHSLMHLNLFLGFVNNEKGQLLADIFDFRFALLLKSGEIKRLYSKWNWPIYPYTQLCSFADQAMVNC